MDGKIALEEHFAIEDTIEDSNGFLPSDTWPELRARLMDVQERRIQEMDATGIELTILSLNAPAVQAIPDRAKANEIAQRANDYLAEQIQLRPDRFLGFAALPLQDPELAAAEFHRCVEELGFCGALVNGFSEVDKPNTAIYYDGSDYDEFWAEVARLDKPFYLHPRNPLMSMANIYAKNHWLLGPTWAFAQETAVHALRLLGSGILDRHPNIQLILGHLGEGIPASLWRIDNRNAWTNAPHKNRAEHPIAHYFRKNVYLTTSGNFHTPTLQTAITEIGVDRVLFSTDWPFENMDHAARWFDSADINEETRQKVGRDNSVQLFGI
jgi:2,3-dihydroxybenzoate decarboxylase|tara:strand:- start:131 stop:1105 length:975 start_codon:yes stop_codon:yes gene_type:complete